MSQNYMHIYTQGKKRGRPKKVKSEEEDTDEDDAEEMEREKEEREKKMVEHLGSGFDVIIEHLANINLGHDLQMLKEGARVRGIYLPAGKWYDNIQDNVLEGPTWLYSYQADLLTLPYFTKVWCEHSRDRE